MSVTTRTNVVSGSALHFLTDYELHHSGDPEKPAAAEDPNFRADLAASSSNPPSWPTDHRAVPPYRPIDRNLDFEQRPAGANLIESIFIATMLNGVRLNAVSLSVHKYRSGADAEMWQNLNRLWRATGGRLNDRIFHYKIGGEF